MFARREPSKYLHFAGGVKWREIAEIGAIYGALGWFRRETGETTGHPAREWGEKGDPVPCKKATKKGQPFG